MQRTPSNPAQHSPAEEAESRLRLRPEDEDELRAALADVAAGRTVELTEEELAEWERTGELPASVLARAAAAGCGESRS